MKISATSWNHLYIYIDMYCLIMVFYLSNIELSFVNSQSFVLTAAFLKNNVYIFFVLMHPIFLQNLLNIKKLITPMYIFCIYCVYFALGFIAGSNCPVLTP